MQRKERVISITLFIVILAFFTAINFKEFIFREEVVGVKRGVNYMETLQTTAVEFRSFFKKIVGQNYVLGTTEYEDVINLGNGYYTMRDPSSSIDAGKKAVAQGMELSKELNIPFLFVLVPPKQEESDKTYGAVGDYALDKYDSFEAWIKDNEIPSLLCRDIYDSSEREYKSYFYRTDHHENTYASFLIYQAICNYVKDNNLFSINEDYTDIANYNIENHKAVFLGSAGRFSGKGYTGLDDYDLFIPKFATNYTLITASQGIERTGDFEEALVYRNNLDGYSYDYYAYYTYLNEDYDITSIVNHNNTNGPRIVILRDSTAVPIASFLSSQCSEIDLISPRYVRDKSMIKEYVISQKPDMIIYCYGTGFLGDENAMCF